METIAAELQSPRKAGSLSYRASALTALLQRKCACGGTPGPSSECEECRKKRESGTLQRKALHRSSFILHPSEGPPILHDVLRSSGQPLDPATRAFMEPRFGYDFSRVRVHTDARAAESARSVSALAYAVGRDVVFGAEQYAPNTLAGRQLLAHELAHVAQQGGAPVPSSAPLRLNPADDRFEHEADRAANAVMSIHQPHPSGIVENNGPAHLSLKPAGIQRTATFAKETVTEDVNPAEQISENKIPERDLFLGQTNFLLNGTSFTGATAKTQLDALHTPTIGSASTAVATGSGSGTVQGVECWFDSVPDNVGNNEIKLLKKGSWTHVTDKKNVAGRFPTLEVCKKGAGKVTFVVKGEPKDDDLRKKVQAHEKHHADDNEAIFKSVVVPWDEAIKKANKEKSKVKAANNTICEKALYNSIGQDRRPNNIVSNIASNVTARADAFHNSDAGGKPATRIEEKDSDCTLVKVRTG